MLDGAEAILREEGYAALTSRRVAERIGVKQRLVYYYFHTMDDLVVATFQRLATRELERLARAVASAHPLRKIWDVCIHTADARLISEFTALANRNRRLSSEVVAFIRKSRAVQVKALAAALDHNGIRSPIPPTALALLATSVALSMTRESELGIHVGHNETKALIAEFLSNLE
jgi:AcrR family transcriptional regulator